jgi:NAD(P)-dependent dehydrogenase (short-subunit alcohol dehydrogenase family)
MKHVLIEGTNMSKERNINPKRFVNKVVVITGGSEGIGFATAKAFATEGAKVYVTGRNKEKLDKAVLEIGGETVGVQGDVASLSDLDQLYDRIKSESGKIDVVFANAGFSESAEIGSIEEDHFDRVFNTNVKGLVFAVQKALPLMSSGGSIILPGSMAGSKGVAALSVYSATKAAIRSFARTWTSDLKHRGIRVNVVSPGVIHTPAMQNYIDKAPAVEDVLKGMTPLGRLGNPEEVAHAVMFLASSESSYIAGIELMVDGGMLAV